jgi:hypothetical protein
MLSVAAALAVCAGVVQAQTVELRIVERTGRSAVTGASDAELNCAVQGRVVGGPAGSILANFTFAIRIVGEPETSGLFARGLIDNADHTYASEVGLSSTVGRGGVASQYSYLAALNASFNGLINTTNSGYAGYPDQDIGEITGDATGSALLNTPGIDADGDGNPDTWSGNGSGAAPPNGVLVGINPGAATTYFAAGGNWIDLYRFRYTVSEFTARTLVFRLQSATAAVGQQINYQGGLWGAKVLGSVQTVATDLLIPVAAPTAAVCCDVTSGGCTVAQPTDCVGMFFPAASACAPNPCATPGVCCASTGICAISIQPQCAGIWYVGSSCAATPCPPVGTCCGPGSQCVVEPAAFCSGLGAWTALATCSAFACYPGACCNIATGACTTAAPSACIGAQFAFAGPAVSCPSATSCPLRACCDLVTAECSTVSIADPCASPLPMGSTCDSVLCPGMICCNTLTGACSITGLSGTCPAGAASSGSGTTCFPSPCPRQICCNTLSGACTLTGAQGVCPAGAVSYGPGTSCASPPCPRQSCCNLLTGFCQTVGAAGTCPAQTVAQNTPTCSGVACVTAGCCNLTTGSCNIIGPSGTCPAGYAPQGPGATCSPGICPTMACCSSTANYCMAVGPAGVCPGGTTALAVGTSCTPNACPPVGRCCSDLGACTMLVQSACTLTWSTGVCSPNTCPVLYPCCNASGVCAMVTENACTGARGSIGVSCTPALCSQVGACCIGLACTARFPSLCPNNDGRRFVGSGTVCGTAANPIGCCIANFNHVDGVNFQDLFDYLNAWFAHDPSADIDHVGGVTMSDLTQFFSAWMSGC